MAAAGDFSGTQLRTSLQSCSSRRFELAHTIGAWTQPWFLAKFAIVVALSGYHGWMVDYGKKLERGIRPVSGKALRIMNEVPGLAVVLIVVLVIVRPF